MCSRVSGSCRAETAARASQARVHCSCLRVKKAWSSFQPAGLCVALISKQLEMSTTRPVCTPSRAPITVVAGPAWALLLALERMKWSLMVMSTSCSSKRGQARPMSAKSQARASCNTHWVQVELQTRRGRLDLAGVHGGGLMSAALMDCS